MITVPNDPVQTDRVQIDRVDPLALDLDTAEQLAALVNAGNEADGVPLPPVTGPTLLRQLQLQSDRRPVDGLWLARAADGRLLGRAAVFMPVLDNTDSARLRGTVHPAARRNGVGRALLAAAEELVAESGRSRIYTGSFDSSPGTVALPALGFEALGTVDAVRHLDLHAGSGRRWQSLYDEARAAAAGYELVRLAGPTPPDMLEDLVTLHAAINDAPADDPELEGDVWTAARVSDYDAAMAGRSQTVHRVLARHRRSGAWAGMSMLCVDEFAPTVAFQEDTSVVRAHRGHRLGLLMKLDMVHWLLEDRPEVAATITWNATTNHHMIAVNEMLGATVLARNANFRKELSRP